MTPSPEVPRRRWYALGAIAAAVVAIVFATIGDGVEVADATGLRRLVVDVGHQLVWALLAGAFAVAAARGRWGRIAQTLAVAAGILYLLFLFAVFLWP
ncbi:hypothetical protein [Microbacterium sp.]|uniref:hypothetical protein n=1 Tax=Microbacterium sp. TaxID=51671 RepID=UPI00289F73ED|nr:hypothetical protein [Microbacterium sp.]